MSKIEDKVKEQLCINFRDGEVAAKPHRTEKYKEYYLADYNMNLYKKMPKEILNYFNHGSGAELKDTKRYPAKMKAKHSSSAFGVNLFGYDKIKIKSNSYKIPKGEYNIRYEEKLETLNQTSSKANIDVCLFNNECVVYIEMKLTEPIKYKYYKNDKKNQEKLVSYTTHSRYNYSENYELFHGVFKEIHDSEPKQYDSMQMLKHLLGICNTIEDKNSELKGKKVFLINCHCWNPLIDEKSDFNEIGKNFIELVNDISKKYNIKVINIDHKQMMEMMEMDEGRREYVTKRYDLSGLKG